MFGRLIDGKFEYAPKNVVCKGKFICNPNSNVLMNLEYLPVKYTKKPEKEGFIAVSYWEQEENEIVQKWSFEKLNIEPTVEERVSILEDAFVEFVNEVMSND